MLHAGCACCRDTQTAGQPEAALATEGVALRIQIARPVLTAMSSSYDKPGAKLSGALTNGKRDVLLQAFESPAYITGLLQKSYIGRLYQAVLIRAVEQTTASI